MKLKNILLIAGITLIASGVAFLVAGSILSFTGPALLSDVFLGVSSILGVLALATLIIRLVLTAREMDSYYKQEKPKVYVKTVDVKDIPKTKEEKLYEQYEDLYKKGFISKEDLELKRKELLGK